MEHLALEVFDLTGTGSQFATLPPNTVIHIRRTSQIFGSGAVFSQEFTLNIPANAHLFGTAGDIHGSRLHEQMNKRKARIWAEGLPLYLGYLRLADEVDVDEDGNVGVTFESGQKTFEEMIDGAKANQVPLMGDVQIGMALWRKRWTKYRVKLQASLPGSQISQNGIMRFITFSGPVTKNGSEWFEFSYDGESEDNSTQQYPRMVFPSGSFTDYGHVKPDEDASHINTDYPYDDSHPYCNVALCYQKSGYKKKNPDGSIYDDYSSEPEAQRGYEVMPANRVNSAPNFFVIYWVRALMKHLGIYVEENQMMDVEDLRRLFFVNTNVAYEEPKNLTGANNTRYGKYFQPYEGIKGRHKLIPEYIDSEKNINKEESGFVGKNVTIVSGVIPSEISLSDKVSVSITDIEAWEEDGIKKDYITNNSWFHKAFATSDCFPNVDISEVVSALESGFGVRLLFSEDYKRVRIVLLRNIFRSTEVQNIQCDIVGEPTKTENSIRGFRMTYGESEDTHFYYKGFADKLPHKKPYFVDNSDKHDYSQWDLNADYEKLIHKVSAFDKTCYVTPNTGDAYGIKVDKDAKRYDDLHPSLFEYAGYMDAEDGDCTGEDETIKEINVGFKPAIMNDVNFEQERDEGSTDQRFALFVDETMRPRRPDLQDGKDYDDPTTIYDVDKLYAQHGPSSDSKMVGDDGIVKPGEFAIRSDMYASQNGVSAELKGNLIFYIATTINFDVDGHINEGCRLYLQDNFEPNVDGICPIEAHDWGLTLGIMRGSGSDAYVNYTHDPDDGEGNDTWDIMAGSSVTAHPDTCDNYGNEWDYDGSQTITPAEAPAILAEMFPNSDAPFYSASLGYITNTQWIYVKDSTGRQRTVLLATEYSVSGVTVTGSGDIRYFVNLTLEELLEVSRNGRHMVVEVDSSSERGSTIVQLCKLAYGGGTEPMVIDNGVGSRYGRFSLKLRAEKLNPYFDPKQAESSYNRRYLPITNENLRGRGLADQFYKEYSYWVRNARIVNLPVRMELAQLLTIDDTVRATVGDVTGFINEMEYDISSETGLGDVTMEVMYI